jgi:hypothetical protein
MMMTIYIPTAVSAAAGSAAVAFVSAQQAQQPGERKPIKGRVSLCLPHPVQWFSEAGSVLKPIAGNGFQMGRQWVSWAGNGFPAML